MHMWILWGAFWCWVIHIGLGYALQRWNARVWGPYFYSLSHSCQPTISTTRRCFSSARWGAHRRWCKARTSNDMRIKVPAEPRVGFGRVAPGTAPLKFMLIPDMLCGATASTAGAGPRRYIRVILPMGGHLDVLHEERDTWREIRRRLCRMMHCADHHVRLYVGEEAVENLDRMVHSNVGVAARWNRRERSRSRGPRDDTRSYYRSRRPVTVPISEVEEDETIYVGYVNRMGTWRFPIHLTDFNTFTWEEVTPQMVVEAIRVQYEHVLGRELRLQIAVNGMVMRAHDTIGRWVEAEGDFRVCSAREGSPLFLERMVSGDRGRRCNHHRIWWSHGRKSLTRATCMAYSTYWTPFRTCAGSRRRIRTLCCP